MILIASKSSNEFFQWLFSGLRWDTTLRPTGLVISVVCCQVILTVSLTGMILVTHKVKMMSTGTQRDTHSISDRDDISDTQSEDNEYWHTGDTYSISDRDDISDTQREDDEYWHTGDTYSISDRDDISDTQREDDEYWHTGDTHSISDRDDISDTQREDNEYWYTGGYSQYL